MRLVGGGSSSSSSSSSSGGSSGSSGGRYQFVILCYVYKLVFVTGSLIAIISPVCSVTTFALIMHFMYCLSK